MLLSLLFFAVVAGGAPAAAPGVAHAAPYPQTACPVAASAGGLRASRLISALNTDAGRQAYPNITVAQSDFRRLISPADDTVCQAIQSALASQPADPRSGQPWLYTFFQVGNYYIVAASVNAPPPAGRVRMGEGGGWLLILDQNLAPVLRTNA